MYIKTLHLSPALAQLVSNMGECVCLSEFKSPFKHQNDDDDDDDEIKT